MVVTFNPAISSRTSFTSNNKNVKPAHTSVVAKPAVQEYKAGKTVANGIAHKARTMFLGLASLAGVAGLSHSCTMDQYSDALNNPVPNKITALAPDSVVTTPEPDLSIGKIIAQIADSLGWANGKEIESFNLLDHDGRMNENVVVYNNDSMMTIKQTSYPSSKPTRKSYAIFEYYKDSTGLGYRELAYSADANFNKTSSGGAEILHRLRRAKEGMFDYYGKVHLTTTVGVPQDSTVTEMVGSNTKWGTKYSNVKYVTTTDIITPHMSPSASKLAGKVVKQVVKVGR